MMAGERGERDAVAGAVARRRQALGELRRYFHERPELSMEERETAATIAAHLRGIAGMEVTEGVGGFGVVGLLHGEGEAQAVGGTRTLMIRADIDALPVQEENAAPYRSQRPGMMHACGHDGHIAIGLTTAETLAELRTLWRGAVKFVFQPAEERIGGADKMIAEGVMRAPDVDAVIGLHLWSQTPVGKVYAQAGPFFASADEIMVRMRGRGGHGAIPHENVDPIVVAAQFVMATQTLVSRELSPFHAAVLTFGAIHGGSAFNITPDVVELRGTVRTYDVADREYLLRRVGELARDVATSMRAEAEYEVIRGCQPCVNDAEIAELVRRAAVATVGEADAPLGDHRQSVSDDMASFLAAAPGCYFLVGVGNVERGITAPHHSPRFDIDEDGLPIGVEVMTRAALEYLR